MLSAALFAAKWGGKSVIRVPKMVPAPKQFITCAKGWRAELFAEGLKHPRMMAVAPNGDVFVVQTRLEIKELNQPHEVVVLSGRDRTGRPTRKTLWSNAPFYPFGIQFAHGHLYVANTDSVVRWPYQPGQTSTTAKPEVMLSGIPSKGYRNHWTRNILFTPDEKQMFLTIGSEENLAEEGPRRAVIERYPVDSSGRLGKGERYASGLRNPIGLAIRPQTGELYANVAERDYKGDELVPDFFTRIQRGGFYGWPYCFLGGRHDPSMPRKPALERTAIMPDINFEAHATPIDCKFIPEGAVVALHGSQNRSTMTGYRVVLIPFKNGRPKGPIRDLAVGWLPAGSNREIYGRPAGLALLGDDILVADDWGGRIWRLRRN